MRTSILKGVVRPRLVLVLAVLIAGAPAIFGQEDETPAAGSVERLIELNRGIRSYFEQDSAAARETLEQLRSRDPDNAACLYYLGLIYLDDGLRLAEENRGPEARERFDLARERFERVTQLADPSVAPVGAALLLGVAQLASDVPAEPGAAVELAVRAKETLRRYVETVDVGKSDRYGFFYLGVANYRLGDHYAKSGKYALAGEHLEAAVKALETSQRLARVDRQRYDETPHAQRVLSEEAYREFDRVVSYYRGLVALQNRENREARRLLEFVRDNDTGELHDNAGAILQKLDEVESEYPLPFSFDSPLGRLDFQGNLALGAGYDTNVILLGKDTRLPLNISRKHDFGFDATAGFNLSRYISRTEAPVGESLSIGIGGTTSHTWHASINEFDINQYAGHAWLNWQPVRDIYLGIEYEYSYTKLGYAPFISSNRLTPVISKIWRRQRGDAADELGRTDVWYNYDYRNYLERIGDKRLNRDGRYNAVGARHIFNLVRAADLWASYYAARDDERRFFGNRWLKASLGYVYRDERTRGNEFDLAGHSILTGVELPLPYRLAFSFDAVFTWEDYAAASVFDYRRNERSDFVQRYDFGLTRTFVARGENSRLPSLEIKLRAGIALTFQDSNIWDRLSQDVYEYDRAMYGLRLEIGF